MKILIVEDAHEIVEVLSVGLEAQWPDVEIISTPLGGMAVDLVRQETPDIVILDLGLTDISGYEVLKQVREFSNVPIMILSVRGDEADIFKGLEWGADDYMTKPFKQAELLARLRALLRRRATPDAEELLTCGNLTYDPKARVAYSQGKETLLTETEGRILKKLMESKGEVVARGLLAVAIWGEDFPTLARLDPRLADASLDRHIQQLRERIEKDADFPEIIITVPGEGYLLQKPGSPPPVT